MLEADTPCRLLQVRIEKLQWHLGQTAQQEILAPRRGCLLLPRLLLLRRPGIGAAAISLGLLDRLVQLLLELLFLVQQVAEGELQLARLSPLRLVAEEATLEQLVFVRQLDDGFPQRLVLRLTFPHAGVEAGQLDLHRRDRCGDLRDGRGGRATAVGRCGTHGRPYT